MVKLKEHKVETQNKKIENIPLPPRVYIPLSQHLGKVCAPTVKIGDSVFTGQAIGKAEAHVYAPVHASISGKVCAIEDWSHPVLGRCKTIVLESDGQDRLPGYQVTRLPEEIDKLTPEQIRSIVLEAGIVGMGGASFPTHIKLNPPKPVDTLIINGAECEPYLTGDYRLMVEKTKEILLGIRQVLRCVGAKIVYIAIEDNKPEAIKAFHSVIGQIANTEHQTPIQLTILKSQYPQGAEKQLIKNILKREVPQDKLPFDIGVVVHNVATCFAIYEAVYKNKPLYERVITVAGSCLSHPKNILARIGTPIKNLIDFCGPLKEEPAKIIVGGPMMGISQFSEEAPVLKSTTGILLFNKKEADFSEELPCIRCGACVRECPVYLMPTLINSASRKEIWQQAKLYGAQDCIECGLCSYVCPSNIMLVQAIKRAKIELMR